MLAPTGCASGRTVVRSEHLFEALDGSALRVGDAEWRMTVYGVIEAGNGRWVQLELDGLARRVVTLRLKQSHGPEHAVQMLASWLSHPDVELGSVLLRVA